MGGAWSGQRNGLAYTIAQLDTEHQSSNGSIFYANSRLLRCQSVFLEWPFAEGHVVPFLPSAANVVVVLLFVGVEGSLANDLATMSAEHSRLLG